LFIVIFYICAPASQSNLSAAASAAMASSFSSSASSAAEQEQQQQQEDDMLRLAATAEQGSAHPLAKAVLEAAQKRGLLLRALREDAVQTFVGGGVVCDTGVGVVLVGNRGFMEANEVGLMPACFYCCALLYRVSFAMCIAEDLQ
jgi:hypothetical protein